MPVIRRNPGREIKTNEYGKVRLWCVDTKEYKEFFPIDAHEVLEKGICKHSAPNIELIAPDGKTTKIIPFELKDQYLEKKWAVNREVDPDEIEEAPGVPDAPSGEGTTDDGKVDFMTYTLPELQQLAVEAGLTDIPKNSTKSVYAGRLSNLESFVPSFKPKSAE